MDTPKVTKADSTKIWYMHDNHTFTLLDGDIDQVIDRARVLGEKSTFGALCPIVMLGADGRELRRVGEMAHARIGFDEEDLARWRTQVLADPDVVRLRTTPADPPAAIEGDEPKMTNEIYMIWDAFLCMLDGIISWSEFVDVVKCRVNDILEDINHYIKVSMYYDQLRRTI